MSFGPGNQLMVGVYSDPAPIESVRLALAIVDQKDRVRVRWKIRQRHRNFGAAVRLRHKAVCRSRPVHRGERYRRLVEMVFEEAVVRVRLQTLERSLQNRFSALVSDHDASGRRKPCLQIEAERL